MGIVPAALGETGELDVRLIRLGFREQRDPGDVRALAASIRDKGLIRRITVSPRYALITGMRRLPACISLGWTTVPHRVISTVQEALDVIAEEDDGCQAKPATIAELIYRDWQIRNELEWWPRAGQHKGTPEARAEHRDKLARAIGLNATQYTRAYAVILAANGYRRSMNHLSSLQDEAAVTAAQDAAKLLETAVPRAISTAYARYRAAIPGEAPALPVTARELEAALAKLTGLVAALTDMAAPENAGRETLQRWDDLLTREVMQPLNRFRRTTTRKQINASQD